MSHTPSWNWLTSRITARRLADESRSTPSRPCLPAIEQLDDRVLLSAAVGGDVIVEPPNPASSSQILIGLLKGSFDLLKVELEALKFAAEDIKLAEVPNLVHKLNLEFFKIDQIVSDFGAALIKGELTEHKEHKAFEQLELEFLKIDSLLGAVKGDEGGLSRLIEGIKIDAFTLLGNLSKFESAGELSHKDQQTLLKIVADFDSLDDAVLKLQEDLLFHKHKGEHKQDYLEIKLNDVLVSSRLVDDKNLQGQLLSTIDATKILIGLLQPGDDFTGGISVIGSTDDVVAG
jgi:hypothetical protein